ncbi:MAG TPA: DNA recombination protein RmuC, partial [Azonexus sp.]|nr:DNA recombination protein RmuC [Azonexus sp.]
MSETMGLAILVGMVVAILLQVAVLLRGNRKQDDEQHELRFRALQEAQEKGLMRLERELREELARGRREDAEDAFRDREERAQSATLLSQAVTTQVGQFGALQAERLEAFARELNRFSLGLD